MKQKIKSRSLIIKDMGIIEYVEKNNIEHIKISVSGVDDPCFVATFPDYKNNLTIGKSFVKIHRGKSSISIRTPNFLRRHIGKSVEIYQDNSSIDAFELFRIDPVDFDIEEINTKRRSSKMNFPYIPNSGFLVVPKKYIKEKIKEPMEGMRISFDRTDIPLIKEGYLFARLTKSHVNGSKSFPLYQYDKGFRTRPMNKLSEMARYCEKQLSDFRYEAIINDDKYNYDIIVFKEIEYDES